MVARRMSYIVDRVLWHQHLDSWTQRVDLSALADHWSYMANGINGLDWGRLMHRLRSCSMIYAHEHRLISWMTSTIWRPSMEISMRHADWDHCSGIEFSSKTEMKKT
mmetsp:Transcript_77247/g.176984  ORF Transcript_77247/g.176984 Transcript_77247/m.176984 type:complete len:107 (-) Transcript_77247:95-415(-)